jgi:hypothetical protein
MLLVAYGADIFIYRNFQVRLDLRDIAIYGGNAGLVWQQFMHALSASQKVWLILGVIPLLYLVFGLRAKDRAFVRGATVAGAGVFVVALAASLLVRSTYSGMWMIRNVIAHNLQSGVSNPYDPAQLGYLRRKLDAMPPICTTGYDQHPNIVLLVTESWSPYHSQLFSGLNNWTPRLDALAKKGRWFSHFFADGGNTDAGLISILVGHQIYSPIKSYLALSPFEGLWNLKSSLPRSLRANGYYTVFMTTGNLSFSGKDGWLRNIGFDEVDGHDSPEYKGLERLNFDAAADEYLYKKALHFVAQSHAKPYLLVLENVSTHPPYISPKLPVMDEEGVIRYLARTVDSLYQGLDGQGFFEHNMLIVVSDHRAMTPVGRPESELFGAAAVARIPAFVISDTIASGRVDQQFDQADLMPSLVNLTSPGICMKRLYMDMFHPVANVDRCLLQAPISDWNSINVFCGDRVARVQLKGSRSYVADSNLKSADAEASVVESIAMQRNFPEIYDVAIERPTAGNSETANNAPGRVAPTGSASIEPNDDK